MAGVNTSTHATTLWTDEAGVSDDQAGIWQADGGLMSDGPGRIFFTSGNGVSPVKAPASKPPGQLAESTVQAAAAVRRVAEGGGLLQPGERAQARRRRR